MRRGGGLVIAVTLLSAACGGTSGPVATQPAGAASATVAAATPPPQVTVKVGYIGLLSDAGIFIAQDKGYFAAEGITNELTKFTTAADEMPLLAAGQLDVGSGGFNPALVNGVAQGLPLRLVADKGSGPKGQGFNVLLARKDHFDSGAIKTIADLKGKTVAIESMASVVAYQLDRALAKVNLSIKDVRTEFMPIPDMVAALANKKVDAAWEVEPFGTLAEARGAGKIIMTSDEHFPDLQIAAIFYGQTFARQKADTAKRWMVAYIKGLRDYNDGFTDAAKRAEIVAILAKNTPVKDAAVYAKMIWPGLHPDGKLNVSSLRDQQDWYKANGQVQQVVPDDRLVDASFAEAAVKQLGPYKR